MANKINKRIKKSVVKNKRSLKSNKPSVKKTKPKKFSKPQKSTKSTKSTKSIKNTKVTKPKKNKIEKVKKDDKKTIRQIKKNCLKKIKDEINLEIENDDIPVIIEIISSIDDKKEKIVDSEDVSETNSNHLINKGVIEQILFKVPHVTDPLMGTPKQVQIELDGIALKMQRRPNAKKNDDLFNKIHLYMHGYLIHLVLRKFPYIKGLQTVDIYQETLIALRFKAIPGFDESKGMSFLNFSKLCIRRHLITLLNTSKNRKKDQSMNRAVSIDTPHGKNGDDDDRNTLSNIIKDENAFVDKNIESNEAYNVTKKTLLKNLSDFEKVVLDEYLSSSSYKEISKNISKRLKKRYDMKSIDNALLRIRKKAILLRNYINEEDIPMFMATKRNETNT